MRRLPSLITLAPALALLAACAPASSNNPPSTPAPDRVLVIDSDGQAVRRSTAGEIARATFLASVDRVWPAMVLAYADLGIEPSVADRAAGKYGNGSFNPPRRIAGRPLSEFFDCGSGLTGPLIDSGRLTASVITTIQPGDAGQTTATTYATGTLRRNEGTSTGPAVCSSTGALEERLRRSIETRLSAGP
jgi:hypothetical protein